MSASILRKLAPGDRRSIGRSNEVAAEVLAAPRRFAELFAGMSVPDELLRMRAADAVEKITARQPALLAPHKAALLRLAAREQQKEVRWHLAQMLPRVALTRSERARMHEVLVSWLNDPSSIVRTFSMQALVDLSEDHPRLRAEARRHVEELTLTGTAAMKARGRRLLKRLKPAP